MTVLFSVLFVNCIGFAVQWPVRVFGITNTKHEPVQFLSSTSVRRLFVLDFTLSIGNEFGSISKGDASMGNFCILETDEMPLLMPLIIPCHNQWGDIEFVLTI